MLLSTCVILSQSSTANDDFMKDVTNMNYHIDYSKMKVKKTNIQGYIEMTCNMSFQQFKKSTNSILIESVNSVLEKKGLKLVDAKNPSEIDVMMSFLDADPDGEHEIEIKIIHKKSKSVISTFKVSSNGDDDGDTFPEMFMPSLQKNGKKIGRQISRLKNTAK